MRNRSVPVDTMLPHLTYSNVDDAISWLTSTLGFEEYFRYGEPVRGAQLRLGRVFVMVSQGGPWMKSPAEVGFCTQMVTVIVDDVDGHFARTKTAGGKIVEELHETVYGERQYGVEDLEGHRWLFSGHVRDVDPSEWGATVTSRLE